MGWENMESPGNQGFPRGQPVPPGAIVMNADSVIYFKRRTNPVLISVIPQGTAVIRRLEKYILDGQLNIIGEAVFKLCFVKGVLLLELVE